MCLTTFWETPPFKVASKHRCSRCWVPVSWQHRIWKTELNQLKAADQHTNGPCTLFSLHLPQHNETKVKTAPDLWVQGTLKVSVNILRHELLASYFTNTLKQTFFLLGASICCTEVASADSVSAGICKSLLSFCQDFYLFMHHCLGSSGSPTFLWLTADSCDYLFKIS